MSKLFGGSMSRDITELVTQLQQQKICDETVAGGTLYDTEVNNMADSIKSLMFEHYGDIMGEGDHLSAMLKEDAESVAQMFKNNLVETQNITSAASMNESALMPSLVTLTASIATTMRTPYEAVIHRLFDTRTIDKQTVDVEEVIPTVKALDSDKDEDLIDALAPYAPVPFVDRTEIDVDELVDGVVPGVKDMPVLVGKTALFKVNRDLRISSIEAEVDGETIPPERISFAKGSVPFFEARDNTLNCLFNLQKADGTVEVADVSARFDFDANKLLYLRADPAITKVYFYATVSHAEHTHPIYTSFRNNFEQFVVPTRPHIEVSLPQEMRTDIANSIHHFANTDVVTAMTENITVIASRMEDQRLYKELNRAYEYEASFDFTAPSNFAYGNLEWIKREFMPFIDSICLKMKDEWNITDCHFRVGVSPYILRILDTDYTMDKAMTEESKGSGVINYSIGVKTATNVVYFISSQMFKDDELRLLLIPNNFKMSQVKTYNYFKYSSFLTDQLRRADNSVQPAIVYSERNLPITFKALQTKLNVVNMPICKTEGNWYIKRV